MKLTDTLDRLYFGRRAEHSGQALFAYETITGRPIWLPRETNVLIGGVPGTGKSSLVNSIAVHLAPAPDVALVGIDMKGGVELDPWTDRLACLAINGPEATALLAEVLALIAWRQHVMRVNGWRTWRGFVVYLFVDELTEAVAPDIMEGDGQAAKRLGEWRRLALESIGRRGRAPGVYLVMATQRPAVESLGSGELRAQAQWRLCLWVPNPTIAEMVVGELPQGVEPWESLKGRPKGTGLLFRGADHPDPVEARSPFYTVEQCAETAYRYRPIRDNLGLLLDWTADIPDAFKIRHRPTQRKAS